MLPVLSSWLRSGRHAMGDRAEDLEEELDSAEVWMAPAMGERLVLGVTGKPARDLLVQQLQLSPERRTQAPTSRVTAKLTPL